MSLYDYFVFQKDWKSEKSQFFRKEVFIQKVKLHVNPLKAKCKENCKILSDLQENMNDL